MQALEDVLADECDRKGLRPTPEAFRKMLTEAIGRLDSHRMISLPQGSISLPDFVRSFVSEPETASKNDHRKPSRNLTAEMKQEIAETRSRSLPSDWSAVRERMTGKTAQMMDEIAAARKGTAR
ncbi:hypothetical protein GGQ85_003665 [Nitrobacter vulgaris]|nr:hypothetical protein [Nitrobacter vulgaris]